MFEIPTTLVASVLANVTAQLADPGTLLVVGAVIGLPLIFWGIKKVKGLFTGSK